MERTLESGKPLAYRSSFCIAELSEYGSPWVRASQAIGHRTR